MTPLLLLLYRLQPFDLFLLITGTIFAALELYGVEQSANASSVVLRRLERQPLRPAWC
jgi:hypothetical protein